MSAPTILCSPQDHTTLPICFPPNLSLAAALLTPTVGRTKLFFDTVCTLADLRFDIFHGTIDADEAGLASQLYYVRPRCVMHGARVEGTGQAAVLCAPTVLHAWGVGCQAVRLGLLEGSQHFCVRPQCVMGHC